MVRFGALVLSVGVLAAVITGPVAQAMPMQVFERMSARDQDDYVGVMIGGAEKVLTDAGQLDLVPQIKKLFTTRSAGDDNTIGMVELELNFAAVNKADADNLVRDPNAKPLAVELAMIATLKANGIILPREFMHVGDNFEPKDPLSPPPKVGLFSQCFGYRLGACVGR